MAHSKLSNTYDSPSCWTVKVLSYVLPHTSQRSMAFLRFLEERRRFRASWGERVGADVSSRGGRFCTPGAVAPSGTAIFRAPGGQPRARGTVRLLLNHARREGQCTT